MGKISFMKISWKVSIGFCLIFLAASIVNGFASTQKWEQIDSVDGVALFRSLEESDELLPFKAIATLNVPYQKVVMALMDAEHKSSWAPKLKFTTIHNVISTNHFEYSEYYTTPWPFDDREFLLLGTVEYKNDRVLFTAQNSTNRNLADENHLLANVTIMEVAITPLSLNKTQVEFTFSGDLGGWIPTFVKNIIQEKWPIRFIQAMQTYIQNTPNLETPRYLSLEKRALSIPEKS